MISVALLISPVLDLHKQVDLDLVDVDLVDVVDLNLLLDLDLLDVD